MLSDDLTIWRYLTPSKFDSLLRFSALWMCRLGYLQDQFEGRMPGPTKAAVKSVTEQMIRQHEHLFPPGFVRGQLENDADRNEKDGCAMLMVSCWFLGENESERMWREYASEPASVAVRSTVGRLRRSVRVWYEGNKLDQVKYVDFSSHDMGPYEGSWADSRAFLKDARFAHESEVRLSVLNDVYLGSLNEDGTPPSPLQMTGPGRFDPERRGQFLEVCLGTLIERIVPSPMATANDIEGIKKACADRGLACPVTR